MATDPEDDKSPDELERYIEVCNEVLRRNRNRFPYEHIWNAAADAEAGHGARLVLVDDTPVSVCEVTVFPDHLERSEDGEDAPVLRISKSYLDDVLRNPQKYVDNPALINWGWLFR